MSSLLHISNSKLYGVATASVIKIVLTSLDSTIEHLIGLFGDSGKAFDVVDHNVLLTKLRRTGIRDIPLDWF